jgi:hypothetical protein
MTTLREAAQQALEVLEQFAETKLVRTSGVINDLRTALAEREQEPVAWMFQHDETGRMNYVSNDGMNTPSEFLKMNPRYTLVCVLYGNPVDDTALLRQALEALEQVASAMPFPVAGATITALRERLGEKT